VLLHHVHFLAKSQAVICQLSLFEDVLTTVLHFLMTVFSYSIFYRMKCIIMFTFTISSFLWNVGLRGREGVRPVLYNFMGRVCKTASVIWGRRGVKHRHFSVLWTPP